MAKKKRKGKRKGGGKRARREDAPQPDVAEAPTEPATEVDEGTAADPGPSAPPGAGRDDEDLDAVLDEDLDGDEDLDALIAATVADAPADEHSVEEEGPGVVVLDEEDELPSPDESPSDLVEAVAATAPSPAKARTEAAADDQEPEVEVLDDDELQDPDTLTSLVVATSPPRPEPKVEVDLDGAIDLGGESTPEDRDRLVAQTLAHAELQDARYRVPYAYSRRVRRWKGAVALAGFGVAGILAVAPPAFLRPDPPLAFGTDARREGLRTALLLQAQQVEAYRARTQRLPDSLDDVATRLEGIRYVPSGNRAYQLVAYESDGNAVVFDSTNPAPAFDGLGEGWWGASIMRRSR